MTYKWARDRTLELIDQYSVGGREVPATYNNQADYLKKIPALLDHAAVIAATGSCKMRAVAALSELERAGEGMWEVYTLPGDFWQLAGGGLLQVGREGMAHISAYRLLPGRRLALPGGWDGEMLVEYFRLPRLLGDDPADGDELDNAVAVQMALPLYAAAHLAMLDNAYAYSALLNEFNGRMSALGELLQTERVEIEDSYSGGGGCLCV